MSRVVAENVVADGQTDRQMDIYRNRLIHLKRLPLMMKYEIADIMLLVKSIKFAFDESFYVKFRF